MHHRLSSGRTLSGPRQASTSAINAPSPRDGEVRRTALPDTFDGIRFEIGRMCKYVEDAAADPVVGAHVRDVCADYVGRAEESARMMGSSLAGADERSLCVEAVDNWCREHFVYVNDPPNIEVLQTTRRMVKATRVPPEVLKHLMEPLFQAMESVAPREEVAAYEPPAVCIGDCDEGGVLFVGQCACTPAPVRPLRFRFGGHEGTLHHVWSRVGCGDKWYDSDLTEPDYRLGDFSRFEHYEEVEVAL